MADWRPTAEEYHADRTHWSSSMFSTFLDSPADAKARYVDGIPGPEPTASMRMGTALNDLLLFHGGIWTYGSSTSGLSRGETLAVRAMLIAIMEPKTPAARFARELLVELPGDPEVAHRWVGPEGLPLKSMRDRVLTGSGAPFLVELKTTRDPQREGFRRSFSTFGYHRQMAHNREATAAQFQCSVEDVGFAIVAVRNEYPFDVVVWDLEQQWLDVGRRENTRLRQQVKACLDGARPWCSDDELMEGVSDEVTVPVLDCPGWIR